MENKTSGTITLLTDLRERLASWLAATDQTSLILALLILTVVVIFRRPMARVCMGLFNRLLKRLSVTLSDPVREELTTTIAVLFVTLTVFLTLEALNIPDVTGGILERILASIAITAVFSGWYNLCGPFVSLLRSERWQRVNMEAGWMERVARFAVLLFAITALLGVWQVDISGALTGVGVLGAGLAIATQDLIRNLVAGMNNMSEKRFSVGEAIQIEGVLVGTVEQIDLRSTLIRGFDQIPRYVPNSELSNAVLLNYAHRKNRRVKVSIPLVLSSTKKQIEQVRDALRDHLISSGDFEISEEAPQHVYVQGLSDSAVELIFYAWTKGPDYADYLQVHENLSLTIMDAIEQADTALAYPTRTIKITNQREGAPVSFSSS